MINLIEKILLFSFIKMKLKKLQTLLGFSHLFLLVLIICIELVFKMAKQVNYQLKKQHQFIGLVDQMVEGHG